MPASGNLVDVGKLEEFLVAQWSRFINPTRLMKASAAEAVAAAPRYEADETKRGESQGGWLRHWERKA